MVAPAVDQDVVILVILQARNRKVVFTPKSLQAILYLMDWKLNLLVVGEQLWGEEVSCSVLQ